MIKKLLLIILTFLSFRCANAQPTGRGQFANNCPDLSMPAIDIYIDGNLFVDDLHFRNSTAFMDVPATTVITIAVAPQNSMSVSDTFYSTQITLQPNDTVAFIFNGTEASTGYNPYRPFRMDTIQRAREMAYDPANCDIAIVHGCTDASLIDVRAGIETIENDIIFGSVRGYNELPFGTYKFRVTNATGYKVYNTYSLPLTLLGSPGQAGYIITSGFLVPAANSNGASFQAMLVPAAGGQFINLPTTFPDAYARVQLINNSADTMVDTVDIYVNNDKVIDNLTFRSASPFFDAAVNSTLNIGIAPAGSSSASDAFYTQAITFDSAKTYISVINGIKSATGYTPPQPLALHTYPNAREEGSGMGSTDILFLHGTTDFPTIDLRQGTNILSDNVSFGNFNGYFSLPASVNYIFTLTNDAGTSEIQKYKAQLLSSGLQGQAITLLLSGFQDPAKNSNGPGYGLYASSSLGGGILPRGLYLHPCKI